MTGTVDRRAFAGDPVSVGEARRWVARALERADRADLVETAELVVSELVTNAVLHAGTEVEVAVLAEPDGGARIEVVDSSPAVPAPRAYAGLATTGRGLGLVAALAADHGIEVSRGGKVVWALLAAGAPASSDPLAEWDDVAVDDSWDVAELLPREPTTAVLRRVPVLLWTVAQQQHEALLRELRLHHADDACRLAALDCATVAHAVLAAAVERAVADAVERGEPLVPLPAGHPSPLPPVPASLDVAVPAVPAGAPSALREVLDEGERLAAAGDLLALPALPEVVDLRRWACEELELQRQGRPPSAWGGVDQEAYLGGGDLHADDDHAAEVAAVRASTAWVLLGDDRNRLVAVSRPAAEGLGWSQAELEGRRIVTLVPPHLREAHVAGFSRHLVTGEAHVLGVPVELPVLHRDGHEVRCRFLVERAGGTGRPAYLVHLEPLR